MRLRINHKGSWAPNPDFPVVNVLLKHTMINEPVMRYFQVKSMLHSDFQSP